MHGCGYSSARLKSRDKTGKALFAQKYGKFEFRAKLPAGKGIWPALWMLPAAEKYGPWAASGEIDVMEAKGHEPGRVHGTIHFGGPWPLNDHLGREHRFATGGITDFHTYAVEWEPGEIRWLVDGNVYSTQNHWWSTSKTGKSVKEADWNAWPAPFDQPFYLVMNVAVGGRFPGNPEKATPFPATMEVDYVRVYEKVGGYAAPKPRGDRPK